MAALIFNGKRVVSREQQAGTRGSYKKDDKFPTPGGSVGRGEGEEGTRGVRIREPLLVDGVRRHRIDAAELLIVCVSKASQSLWSQLGCVRYVTGRCRNSPSDENEQI